MLGSLPNPMVVSILGLTPESVTGVPAAPPLGWALVLSSLSTINRQPIVERARKRRWLQSERRESSGVVSKLCCISEQVLL